MEEEVMEAIENAVSNNDLESLKNLLANKTPEFCGQALHFTLNLGINDFEEIYRGFTMNVTRSEEDIRAIENKYKELVKLFLDHGADVNVLIDDFEGYSNLGFACRYASADIVKMMIDHGADLNFVDRFDNLPIQHVFGSGQREKINLFFDRGITAEDINRLHLLHLYIEFGNPQVDILTRILQLGADVNGINQEGYTVLNCAIVSENLEVFKMLINKGANVNGIGYDGDSELGFAVKNMGPIDTIKILLEQGAYVNLGKTKPLIIASRSWRTDRQEILELLLNNGANINERVNNFTPIRCSAISADEQMIEFMLKKGATRDNYALFEAICRQHTKIVKLLLDRGFDANCVVQSETALSWAVSRGNKKIVELLLDYGARINELPAGSRQYTLHHAAEKADKEIFQLLLGRGADINAEHNGKTALTILIQRKSYELCKLLVRLIVLMKSKDLLVGDVNLNAIETNEELCVHRDKCESEIKLLINEKFDDSLSYCDILKMTDDVRDLATLSDNEAIVKIVNSDDLKNKFPVYWDIIVERLTRN